MRRVRVAAFGAGWVTENRHIPSMRAHGGFDVVALVDRRPERAREMATRLGIPRHAGGSTVGELPFLDDVDAVTCGTAPFAHHAIVKSALEAGKHAITEKPFTMTLEEGEELAGLARETGLTLAVVHNFQFARSALKVRRWIADGRVGAPRALWAAQLSNPRRRLPDWFDDLPFGLFYDESPHLIYLLRALAGGELSRKAVHVHPSTRGLARTPAQIDVQMSRDDVPVAMQMNFEAPLSEWHVMVLGENGLGAIDVFRDIAVWAPNDGGHRAPQVLRSSASMAWSHWRGHVRSGWGHLRRRLMYGNEEVFRRFHEAVTTGTRPEGIHADDALAVLELQHWILQEGQASLAGASRSD
jgi:predicted dehydrogenase